MKNALTLKDGYKTDHKSQYPKKTEQVFSNFTPRKSRVPGVDEIGFFGLQYFIIEYLQRQWNETFFNKPKEQVVKAYKRRIDNYLGPGAVTFEHIEALHDLGYLPIQIMALPEGSFAPVKVSPMVIFVTNDDFGWLTNLLETIKSCVLWGPCTSLTTAMRYRKILNHYADKTVGSRDFVQWQGHDFSMRGMFGPEAAAMSGAAHLLAFTGTDTIPAIDFLEEYYGADCEKELIGGSVAATEHSVMCMGSEEGEIATFERLICEVYPKGIVSIVSDTWDFWQVITVFLPQLKEKIMAREGKVVIRPDSGNPVDIICGLEGVEMHEAFSESWHKEQKEKRPAEYKGAIECLWDIFGGTITEKGYKQLDPHIGLIYGDSITPERCEEICRKLEQKGFASTNVVFGIGSYTYQYVTRDTFGFAVKATYGVVNGEPRNIFKSPKTDDGTKKSAKGLLAVYRNDTDGAYYMQDEVTWKEVMNCEYRTVFKDGELLIKETLSDIRARLK